MPQRHIDRRRLWHRFLVISGLSAAAVAAPLLDLYGRNPEVFVANRAGKGQIVLFALLVALVPPIVGLVILVASELTGPKTAELAYLTMAAVAGATIGLVISRQVVPENTIGAIALAVVIAAALVLVFRRIESVLALFSLTLLVLLGLFLAVSPTSRLIWEQPAAAATDGGIVGKPSSIVLLQLDEFPLASLMDADGTINERLFPNFARLADTGTWYRNAFSPSIATTQSVPATVTGRIGSEGLSPTAADYPKSLFTLLGDSYDMHVIEWVADLCPEEICQDYAGRAPARFTSLLRDVGVVYGHLFLPALARENLPSIDNTWKGFLGQEDNPSAAPVAIGDLPVPRAGVRSEWIDWLQRIINGIVENQPPTLHYAHLTSPHVPWRVNPSGTHYQRPEQYSEVEGVQGSGFWIDDENYARLGFQRHLYQLGFLDRMLGSLFEQLESTQSWDDTMIVVTADHGASFVPGEHRRWPYENNRDDLYRVPLFVKYPGEATGEIRDEPAFTIDIMPTIVDALEIDTDWEFDGVSLLDIEGTNRPHTIEYWCCSREGVSTDLSILFDQVVRNHRWIPVQDTWRDVASVGPYRDLVGDPVFSLVVTPSEDMQWSFDDTEGLTTVDRNSGMAQTLILGRLELPGDITGNDLLITINGQIAGAGFLSRDTANGGQLRGLVAEEYLEDVVNEVGILIPDSSGTGWVTGTSADVSLQFVADDGHILDLREEGGRRIQIDEVTQTDSGWTVAGWSADISRKMTPDRIYIFAGDTLVAAGPPNRDNRNVVRWYDSDDLLRSGFSFDIPAESVPNGADRLMVVAEFGGYAVGDPALLE